MEKIFLILEPSNHMLQVADAAHRKGYKVVSIHTLPYCTLPPYGPLYESISESFKVSSWNDHDEILKLVTNICNNKSLVGTYAAYEITLLLEAKIRESYSLPTNGYEKTLKLINKSHVRKCLQENGLTNLKTKTEDELRKLDHLHPGEEYFVKPVWGAGSAYISKCDSISKIEEALRCWDSGSDEYSLAPLIDFLFAKKELFAEEAAIGKLVSLEGWVFDGHYQALGLTSKSVLKNDDSIEMGHVYPYRPPFLSKIIEKVSRIHEVLGVVHGATHTEIMISDDGGIELIELNMRFAGADILSLINIAQDVKIEEILVNISCGEKPQNIDANKVGQTACLQYILPPHGVNKFESIDFQSKSVVFKREMQESGAELKRCNKQEDRIVGFIVKGVDREDCLEKADQIRYQTLVNGKELGEDINNLILN